MSRGKLLLVNSAILALGYCVVSLADSPLSLNWGDATLKAEMSPESQRWQVEIGDADTGTPIPLSYHFKSVTSMSVVKDRLLLVGDQRYGETFCIIDLTRAKVLVESSCFRPVVSPDGTYVAFERFFLEAHRAISSGHKSRSSTYCQKRLRSRRFSPSFDPPAMESADFHVRKVHVPMSPLIWSEDSRYLIYFDHAVAAEQDDVRKDYTINLMVFEFDKTKRTNSTRSAIVLVDEFVNHTRPAPPDRVTFAVKELKFVDDSGT